MTCPATTGHCFSMWSNTKFFFSCPLVYTFRLSHALSLNLASPNPTLLNNSTLSTKYLSEARWLDVIPAFTDHQLSLVTVVSIIELKGPHESLSRIGCGRQEMQSRHELTEVHLVVLVFVECLEDVVGELKEPLQKVLK